MNIRKLIRVGLIAAGALIVVACGGSAEYNGQRVGGIWFGESGSPLGGSGAETLIIGSESGQMRELDPDILGGDYFGESSVSAATLVDDIFFHRVTEFTLPDIDEVLETACAFGEFLELDVLPPEENAECSDLAGVLDEQELLGNALIRSGDTHIYAAPRDGISEEFAMLLCDAVGLDPYSDGCADYLDGVLSEDNEPPAFPAGLRVYANEDFLGLQITGDMTEGEGQEAEEYEVYFSLAIDLGIVEFLDDILDGGSPEDLIYLLAGLTFGEADDELYFEGSSLDELEGIWGSINADAGFFIQDTGFFEGGEDGPCLYTGWFSIIDPQYNMYAMTLLADCGGESENSPEDGASLFSGVYEGLAFIGDADDLLFEYDGPEDGKAMIFHVSNNGAVISDALVSGLGP